MNTEPPWHLLRRPPTSPPGAITATAKAGASSSFFDMPLVPTDIVLPTAAAPAAAAMDELEKYLELPVEKNMDLDVLAWWKAKDCAPKDGGLPALAKMARSVPRPPGVVGGRRAHVLQGRQAL